MWSKGSLCSCCCPARAQLSALLVGKSVCRYVIDKRDRFRCSIAAANTDKLQFKFKFYSYVMWNCVDDKNDNEEGRAPLEYLSSGPRVSSYATAKWAMIIAHWCTSHCRPTIVWPLATYLDSVVLCFDSGSAWQYNFPYHHSRNASQ